MSIIRWRIAVRIAYGAYMLGVAQIFALMLRQKLDKRFTLIL